MGRKKAAGFTIIETLLFLSITGLLVVALLAGVGVSINTQRYRDSVNSFQSFIQDQYAGLQNVFNGRTSDWSCTNAAVTIEGGSSSEGRGRSDCVLLGKYIFVRDSTIETADVVGYEMNSDTASDIDAIINNYELGLSSVDLQSKQLDWGTRIAWPISGPEAQAAGASRSIAILIIQSPVSNSVYTFTSDDASESQDMSSDSLKAMIVTGNTVPGQAARIVCIDADGLSISGNSAVYLSAYSTNASSIETRSNEVILELGGTSQC